MYDPAVVETSIREGVRAWKPALPGVREVLHARFVTHRYPPHVHDDWTVCLVDSGIVRFDLDRHARHTTPSMVSLLPPHVVHDGWPGTPRGYRKRVLYVDTNVLPTSLIGPAVDHPDIEDPAVRLAISALHDDLLAGDVLEAETRFALVMRHLRGRFGRPDERSPVSTNRLAAHSLRDYLDSSMFGPVTLAAAAIATGWSQAHLAHTFRAEFGISPHTYLVGRRLDAARDRILAGQPSWTTCGGRSDTIDGVVCRAWRSRSKRTIPVSTRQTVQSSWTWGG